MQAPSSFNIPNGHILKLKKGIYSMKQRGHVWYIDFSSILSELGYIYTEADNAIFIYKTSRFPNIITTYVDNTELILKSLE